MTNGIEVVARSYAWHIYLLVVVLVSTDAPPPTRLGDMTKLRRLVGVGKPISRYA